MKRAVIGIGLVVLVAAAAWIVADSSPLPVSPKAASPDRFFDKLVTERVDAPRQAPELATVTTESKTTRREPSFGQQREAIERRWTGAPLSQGDAHFFDGRRQVPAFALPIEGKCDPSYGLVGGGCVHVQYGLFENLTAQINSFKASQPRPPAEEEGRDPSGPDDDVFAPAPRSEAPLMQAELRDSNTLDLTKQYGPGALLGVRRRPPIGADERPTLEETRNHRWKAQVGWCKSYKATIEKYRVPQNKLEKSEGRKAREEFRKMCTPEGAERFWWYEVR
jgi:hypothetical protein